MNIKIMAVAAAAMAAVGVGSMADVSPSDNIRLALNMFSNQRACKVGDLLTITVLESMSSTKSEDLKTEKTMSADADAPYFGTRVAEPSNMYTVFRNAITRAPENSLPIAQYKIASSSKFNGAGSANSVDKLSMNFTVRVVDLLENGVLVVRGDRRVTYRNESVSMVLTGLVRTRDISEFNIVESSRVADAHIYYETDGEVSRGSRPGYFWRFFQFLNPL